jgi:hypothetical protein
VQVEELELVVQYLKDVSSILNPLGLNSAVGQAEAKLSSFKK